MEVGIVASNTATTYFNSTELDNLPLTVNILDFPGEATLHLADIEVELPANGDPVCFKQIRLILAAEGDPDCPGSICNYVVETGDLTQYELKTPSGHQSGVKILTPNDFCIDADNDAVQVSIDFDPARAIVHNGRRIVTILFKKRQKSTSSEKSGVGFCVLTCQHCAFRKAYPENPELPLLM